MKFWIIIYSHRIFGKIKIGYWNFQMELFKKSVLNIFAEQNQITTPSFLDNILKNFLVSIESEKMEYAIKVLNFVQFSKWKWRFNGKWCHIISKRGSQDKQNNNLRVEDFYLHSNEQRFWPWAQRKQTTILSKNKEDVQKFNFMVWKKCDCEIPPHLFLLAKTWIVLRFSWNSNQRIAPSQFFGM